MKANAAVLILLVFMVVISIGSTPAQACTNSIGWMYYDWTWCTCYDCEDGIGYTMFMTCVPMEDYSCDYVFDALSRCDMGCEECWALVSIFSSWSCE